MSAQTDKAHALEVEAMNSIMGILKEFDFTTQDRILTWVQMRIEMDWDE